MKKRKIAMILSLILGGIGIQRFYLGQGGKGIISILFCWTYIPLIIGIIDFFKFLQMRDDKFDYLFNDKSTKHCVGCKDEITKRNSSRLGRKYFLEPTELCQRCFEKVRAYNKKTGDYNLTEEKLDEITAKATKSLTNRPLPKLDTTRIVIPDNDEIIDLPEEVDGVNLNLLVQIDYVDSMGIESTRRITIKHISSSFDSDYYLKAYCHEKEAMRTFKLSRIENMVDMETGEVIEDIGNYFLERFNDSPIGVITKVLEDFEPQILIFVYMARADGYLRKKEREIIVDFIAKKSDKEIDWIIADKEIRRTFCEIKDLRKMLKIMKTKSKEDKELLVETVDKIMQTDKNIDPLEQGTFNLIIKEIE